MKVVSIKGRYKMQQEDSSEKLTARQWADINAQALTERNEKLLAKMVDKLDAVSRRVDEDREKIHWRRVFAAEAIGSGRTCGEAIAVSNEMIDRLFD